MRLTAAGNRIHRSFAQLQTRIDGYSAVLSGAFVFLSLLLVYLATATKGGEQSADPLAAAIPAWQFVTHGNMTLDAFEGTLPWFIDNGERIVSNRTPGVIFFGVPFYLLLGTDAQTTSLLPAAFAAVTAAAGAMTMLHLAFRRLTRPSTAMGAALIAGVATSTWSVSADALWGHGPNQLWLAMAILALAAERYLSSGVGFGLAIFTRPQVAVISAVAGLWAGVRKPSLRPVVFVGVPAALGLIALVYYNSVMFGEISITGGYGDYVTRNLVSRPWWHYGEQVAGTLVSPDRGFLVMSPFILALLPGLRAGWRVAPFWVRSCAVGGIVYMLVQLRINDFSGGNNFYSYRLSLEMLTVAAPLLLLAYREWTARTALRKRFFFALVLLSVAIQGLGAIYHEVDYVERSAWGNFKVWNVAQEVGPSTIVLIATGGVLLWALLSMATQSDRSE